MAGRYAAAGIVLALALAVTLNAQGRWYPPYERGVKAVNAGRWEEGIGLLEQARFDSVRLLAADRELARPENALVREIARAKDRAMALH